MPRKTTSAFKTCPQLFSTFTTGEKTVQLGELQVKSNKDNLMRESPRETWDRSNKASSREGHVKDFPLLHWLPGRHSCRDCGLQVLTSAVELAGGRMEMGKLTCPQRTLPSEIQMVSGFCFACCVQGVLWAAATVTRGDLIIALELALAQQVYLLTKGIAGTNFIVSERLTVLFLNC